VINIWLQTWVWKSNSLFKNSRLSMRRQFGRSPKIIIQFPLTQILRIYYSLPPVPNMFYNSHLSVSFLQELFLMSECSRIGLGRPGCTLKRNTSPYMLLQSVPITRQNENQLEGNRFEIRLEQTCADRWFPVVLRNWQDIVTVLVPGWVALLAIFAVYNI